MSDADELRDLIAAVSSHHRWGKNGRVQIANNVYQWWAICSCGWKSQRQLFGAESDAMRAEHERHVATAVMGLFGLVERQRTDRGHCYVARTNPTQERG